MLPVALEDFVLGGMVTPLVHRSKNKRNRSKKEQQMFGNKEGSSRVQQDQHVTYSMYQDSNKQKQTRSLLGFLSMAKVP